MEYNGIKEERWRFTKKPGDVSKSLGGTAITIRKRSERHSRWGRVPRQPRVETTENEGRKRERERERGRQRRTMFRRIKKDARSRWNPFAARLLFAERQLSELHTRANHTLPSFFFFFFFKEGPFFSGEKGSRNVPVFLSTFNFHHAFIARRIRITNFTPSNYFHPLAGCFRLLI